ncbi:MAG: S8 family serine peptidase [Candidatus Sericytochromatia bacterium]
MKIKHLFQTLLAGLLILSACQTQPTANNALPRSITNASKAAFANTKGPYTGPVSLKIDTGLIKKTTGKILDINPNQGGFQTQAVPNGPVVFSENLLLNQNKEQEWLRNFKAPDTSKRYIVHVAKQESQNGKEGRVQLNLNGAWVIREKDFERGEKDFETTGLLLNGNNFLKIRLKGKTGSQITVTVVEAGEAGTILRRRGWEKDKDLTQADRIRNNDTNIFDPNDPSSLGGLQPYEGDLISTTSPDIAIGETEANGSRSRIFTGEVLVALQEPRTEKLQALLERFPVEVLSTEDFSGLSIAHLRLKFDEVSLNTLAENIQALNTRDDAPALLNAKFSSINTAKTLALTLDLQRNATDLIYNVALHNPVVSQEAATLDSEEETNTSKRNLTSIQLPFSASKFWWLNQTHVREAWNYSGGHNMAIAILDTEFGYIHDKTIVLDYQNPSYPILTQQIKGYPEFKERVITALPPNQSYLIINSKDDTQIKSVEGSANYPPPEPPQLSTPPGHGLFVSQLVASAKDDQQGIVGVAPFTKILPMTISTGFIEATDVNSEFSITKQLNRLIKENVSVDVINISTGRQINFWDLYIWSTLPVSPPFIPVTIRIPVLSGISTLGMNIAVLQDRINKLTAQNTIVVASGGNDGVLNNDQTVEKNNIPSTLDNVIGVGAYQRNNLGFLEQAIFNDGKEIASNYGSKIDIWAPGKEILVLDREYNGSNSPITNSHIGYEDQFITRQGTSYAAPQVAGVIALMKSWKKSLNTQEALNILRSSGEQLNSFNFSGTPNPVGLNALAAIKHPSINAKPYQAYTGTAQANGTVLINGTTYTTKPHYLDLDPTIQVGSSISLSGWLRADNPNIPANEIHLIGLETNPLQLVQFLPTVGALDPIPFTIANQHYLAIPNYFSGSTYHISSHIYRWNGSQFILHQAIPTFGAYDLLPFKIGNQTFLAVANYDETRFMAASEIYRWDGAQFVPFQSFADTGGVDWEYFEIDGGHYLALANFFNGSFSRQSQIFKWNGVNFAPFQTLQTNGAHKWTHFMTTGTEKYLALTTYLSANQNDPVSELYKWNGSQFVFNQTFATDNDMDFEPFTINGQLYTAIINNGRINDAIESKILKWENNRFVDFQNVSTTGARNWNYFSANNGHYLVLTSNAKGPQIYRWNGNTFELYHEVSMVGAWGSALFNPNPTEYFLILSSLRGALGYADPSRVYKFNP